MGGGYETYYNLLMYLKAIRAVITLAMPECLMGPLWFLESLFVSSILLLLLDYIVSLVASGKKRRVLVFTITLILFIIAFITTDVLEIIFPRRLNRDLGCLNFIYIGYLFSRIQSRLSYKPLITALCTFLLFITAYIWGTISITDFSIRNPLITGICAIMGWFSSMGTAKLIEQHCGSLSDFFDYVGKHTITILIFHIPTFKLITLITIFVYNFPISKLASFPVITPTGLWWIVYSIVGVSIPLVTVWGIKYLKKGKALYTTKQ